MTSHGRQVGAAGERAARRPHAERHLVLVHEPGVLDWRDLDTVAREVEALADDIEVFVVSNEARSPTTCKWAAGRPTLVFSPTVLRAFRPLRGKVYAGALIPKDMQARRLVAAGIPVPDFVVLEGDIAVDPDRFGPLAILKPSGFTSHGRGMQLVRTEELVGRRWRDHPAVGAAGAAGAAPMILQRRIDTGEYPSHTRVMTVFGEPVFAFRALSTVARPPLDAPFEVQANGPLMATHAQRKLEVPVEDDVLALAQRTYAAIPEVALHGCDIIRAADGGGLYVLEINPGGNTWSFSSPWTDLLRRQLAMPDLSRQFDAWKTLAKVFVDRVRGEAA